MDALAYLQLLAADADLDAFDEPVRLARDTGADTAPVEQARTLALGIRATLQSRRRREAELAALYDTAGDLSALHDVDAVLHSIVRRARTLLTADVSYLTLNDTERGDTYMRVTDGSVSARFQRVRLPMGAGLGGLVAQRSAPYATANYFTDPRFRQTEDISGAVVDEGLVSILGVPLLRGTTVTGVLFAANRTERPFSREEVALLGSLAAHAGIAIDNARLIEQARTTLDELNQVTVAAVAHSEAVERAAAAHERLTDVVAAGGGLDEVAATVSDVLGGHVVLADGEGHPLAEGGPPPTEGQEQARLARLVTLPGADGRARRTADGRWVSPVDAGGERLGVLVLDRGRDGNHSDLDQTDRRILERAGTVTALLLLFRRTVAEARGRVRGDLVSDVLDPAHNDGGRSDTGDVLERARQLGLDLSAPHLVVVAAGEAADRRRLGLPAGQLADRYGGLAGEHEGQQVLLLPDSAAQPLAEQVSAELSAALRAPVTAGAALADGSGLRTTLAAHREARLTLDALRALGRGGTGAAAAGLGFLGVLIGGGPDQAADFVERVLGPVLRYDAQRRTDLTGTLTAWFAHDRSTAATQRHLHVHLNTVRQRLDRVASLLGPGWDAPEELLQLQLALQLHRVRGSP